MFKREDKEATVYKDEDGKCLPIFFSQANNVMVSEFKKISGIHDDCVCVS